MSRKHRESRQTKPSPVLYRAEASDGITSFLAAELRTLGATHIREYGAACTFSHPNIRKTLPQLRVAHAVYHVERFDVPRPKALLGDEHFRRLRTAALAAQQLGTFTGVRIEAAGKESGVMQRIGEELAAAMRLPFVPDDGDFVVRIVRDKSGWSTYIRLSERPVSTRQWRVCNIPGGLHAPLAVVMNQLAGAKPHHTYVNLMAGSGTLAIEHARAGGSATVVEINPKTVTCLRENLEAARVTERVTVLEADALAPHPELPDNAWDVVVADPPWGDAVGAHRDNRDLHEQLFAAAERLLTRNGIFVVITHEIRLVTDLLHRSPQWKINDKRQVSHGGHNPLILTLSVVKSAS